MLCSWLPPRPTTFALHVSFCALMGFLFLRVYPLCADSGLCSVAVSARLAATMLPCRPPPLRAHPPLLPYGQRAAPAPVRLACRWHDKNARDEGDGDAVVGGVGVCRVREGGDVVSQGTVGVHGAAPAAPPHPEALLSDTAWPCACWRQSFPGSLLCLSSPLFFFFGAHVPPRDRASSVAHLIQCGCPAGSHPSVCRVRRDGGVCARCALLSPASPVLLSMLRSLAPLQVVEYTRLPCGEPPRCAVA